VSDDAETEQCMRALEAARAVWDWTKGNKYRAITGPHWNYCNFEMWIKAEPGHALGAEWVVNHEDPAACYVMAAIRLGLL